MSFLGLKEFYYAIEDKYYALIDWLSKNGLNLKPLVNAIESKGIPSLLVFTAFLLIIVGGVLLSTAGLSFGEAGASTVSIRVQTIANEPLPGALVAISGVGYNQSLSTGADGLANFVGIPSGRTLLITISKEGYGAVTRSFIVGQTLPPFILRTATGEQVTLLAVTEDNSPVPQAQVSYITSGQTRNTVTSSQGVAQLSVSIGQPVTVTVSGQGYDTATETFTPASAGYQHQVTLLSSLGSVNNFNSLSSLSRRVPSLNDDDDTNAARTVDLSDVTNIRVTVKNSTNGAIEGATVVIFNYADQSELGAGETDEEGVALLESVPVGVNAYVAVDADGYVSQTTAPRVIQENTVFTVSMPVATDTSASNLTVKFSDDTRSTSFSVEFAILEVGTNAIIKKMPRRTSREIEVENLPAGKNVYISAFSTQHVRYASESFTLEAGSEQIFELNLTKKTDANAVDVRVQVVDFYNEPVSARVTVTPALASNGHLLMPGENSSAGNALLRNIPLQPILITASNGTFFGENALEVSLENTEVTVTVLPVAGEVQLRAVDMLSNIAVEGASYTVSYNSRTENVVLAGCPLSNVAAPSPVEIQNGLCTLTLASGIVYTLKTSAAGYFDKVQTFVLSPSERTELEVQMVSTSSNEVMSIEGFRIIDSQNEDVLNSYAVEEGTELQILKAGEIYTAVFNVLVRAGSKEAGAYLRMGDEGSIGNALVYKGFPIDDTRNINGGLFSLKGASSYQKGSCGNEIAANQVGALKWIGATIPSEKYSDFEINPTGDTIVQVKVPFLVAASTPNRLNVSFRAYNVMQDGSYLRSPSDEVMGVAREASGKRECDAAVYQHKFKVASADNKIVQCSAKACLTLKFTQGGREGVESFEVQPAVIQEPAIPNPLFLEYSIMDFAPDFDEGTEMTFKTDKRFLAILQKADQEMPLGLQNDDSADFNVNTLENVYSVVSKRPNRDKGSVEGNIETHATLERNPAYPIELVYGTKVTLSTKINLVGLPVQIGELAQLPAYYTLLYNASQGNDVLTLLYTNTENGEVASAQSMTFYSDPILPADAVMLLFNFSNAPCEDLIFNLFDDSGCFEQVNDPRAALSLPQEYQVYGDKLLMMKYDASTDECQYHSKNPNTVKTTSGAATLKVVSSCTQKSIEIPFDVRSSLSNQANVLLPKAPAFTLAEFDKPYYAVTVQKQVWNEPAVPEMGVDASFLHVLFNNRQYSKDNYVRIYTGDSEDNAVNYMILDNALVVPVQGLKSIASYESAPADILGIDEDEPGTDALLRVYDPKISQNQIAFTLPNGTQVTMSIENQADSMEASRVSYLNVLKNTAFRRRQDCNPPRPCPFGMFPYSAFVNLEEKPAVYHLGGDLWTGKYGNGKNDFEFFGAAGTTCDAREQEGIYDYYWEYKIRKEDGNVQQDKKFAPLTLGALDYATYGCSREQQLCGKLSFNGGQCIQNCGDGWYYDATPGLTSSICSGNAFKVEDVRSSSNAQGNTLFDRWWRSIPNALVSCLAQEYAGAYAGCAVGSTFGPVGGLVGTRIGALIGGEAYDFLLGDALVIGDHVEGDVPGFANFLGKWAQACSYAGTALDVANAVSSLKGVAALGEYECPGAWSSAVSKCFCYNELGGFDPECAAERALRGVVSANAFRDTKTHIHDLASDVATAQQNYDAASGVVQRRVTAAARICDACTPDEVDIWLQDQQAIRDAPSSTPAQIQAAKENIEVLKSVKEAREGTAGVGGTVGAHEDLKEAVSRAKASGFCAEEDDIAKCSGKMKEMDDKLSGLDAVVGATCGPMLTAASGMLILGSVAANAPDRAYLAINNEGNTDFDGTFGLTGPDVDCADNTDVSRDNLDVWMDLDFSSLRVKEDKEVHCMDRQEIATISNEEIGGGIDWENKKATFYISSRG